jgi:single-strand DNA-binding protein
MNNFIGMGRLTKDPEISTSTSGTEIAKFSIAVDRKFKRDGQPTADFFNCTCFKAQAQFVEKYLKKGTKILVSGPIQIDSYTTKTGEKKISVTVMVNEIEFAESKAKEEDKTEKFLEVADIADLPFS